MTAVTVKRETPQNSVISYHALDDLKERQDTVLRIVAECPGASALDVFKVMRRRGYKGEPKNISSRLTELKQAGLVKVTGKKVNRVTRRSADMFEIVENKEVKE